MERVLMPKQGNTVESCVILEWKKKIGDTVLPGDVLCEVETDKATFEVQAEHEGVLLTVLFNEGDDVPVLETIAYLGKPGEILPEAGARSVENPVPAPLPSPVIPVKAQSFIEAGEKARSVRISPRAKNLAERKGIVPENLEGSGPGGRILERDVCRALQGRSSIGTAALQKAEEEDLSIPAEGSGIGGRVLTTDFKTVRKSGWAEDFPGNSIETVVKGAREVIARRMKASQDQTAQFTLHAAADAREIVEYRQYLKTADPSKGLSDITLGDLVLYAVSRVLPAFPFMNAHFLGEKIVSFEHVHLGIAVDTPKGLLVPTVRFADTLSLKGISDCAGRLAEKAKSGKANPEDLIGATFTVTNLGSLGIEGFTPVLNTPQVAILGVCSITLKPIGGDGDVTFIPHLGLSLTIDHQAVDGAPAARFLKELCDALARFRILLAE